MRYNLFQFLFDFARKNFVSIEALQKSFIYVDVMLSHFQFPQTDVEPALHLVGIAALRAAVKLDDKQDISA
jgi:hypothetical protein